MEILIPDIPVMSPFDLIVLLVIRNAVQNALIGNENSLGGGLIAAAALLVMNGVVAWGSARFRSMVVSVGGVRYAIPEEDGHVSVIRRRPA